MTTPAQLNIDQLYPPHLLDEAELDALSGCARVGLSADNAPPQTFRIEEEAAQELVELTWTAPSNAQRRTYPLKKAAEDGAAACAFVALNHAADLAAYARCEEGFHADYFMLPAGQTSRDIEHCTLLEVTGVAAGGRRAVANRLSRRSRRLRRRQKHLRNAAMTCAVGFDSCMIRIKREKADGLA